MRGIGSGPTIGFPRKRDRMAVNPGLSPVVVGQTLARGLDRPLIGTLPLRLIGPISERDVQQTLDIALDACARMTRERMNE